MLFKHSDIEIELDEKFGCVIWNYEHPDSLFFMKEYGPDTGNYRMLYKFDTESREMSEYKNCRIVGNITPTTELKIISGCFVSGFWFFHYLFQSAVCLAQNFLLRIPDDSGDSHFIPLWSSTLSFVDRDIEVAPGIRQHKILFYSQSETGIGHWDPFTDLYVGDDVIYTPESGLINAMAIDDYENIEVARQYLVTLNQFGKLSWRNVEGWVDKETKKYRPHKEIAISGASDITIHRKIDGDQAILWTINGDRLAGYKLDKKYEEFSQNEKAYKVKIIKRFFDQFGNELNKTGLDAFEIVLIKAQLFDMWETKMITSGTKVLFATATGEGSFFSNTTQDYSLKTKTVTAIDGIASVLFQAGNISGTKKEKILCLPVED